MFISIKHKKQIFPFQKFGKIDIPYITIEIQGHPLNMLVDTGSAASFICEGVVNNLKFAPSPRRFDLCALTDESYKAECVTVEFILGNTTVSNDFAVFKGSSLGNFESSYGIPIHGLLGSEFLDSTGAIIDFNTHSVKLA